MYNSKVGTRLFEYIETVNKNSVDYFIARVLLQKLDDFPDIQIEEIAYLANTTASSITKFCKKLGYDSFKSLRYDIGEYSSKIMVDQLNHSSLEEYMHDFHRMELENDQLIIECIHHETIQELTKLIQENQRILILQASYNHNIISFLSEILTAFGKKVISLNRNNQDHFILENVENSDIVILTSLTGEYIHQRQPLLKQIQKPLYIIGKDPIPGYHCIYMDHYPHLFNSYYNSQRYIYIVSLLIHYYLNH